MDLQAVLLKEIETCSEGVNSLSLARKLNNDHQKIVGAVKSLQTYDGLVDVTQGTESGLELTTEGEEVVTAGSHEYRVYSAIPPEGIEQPVLMKVVPNAKIGFSKAMSAGWIELKKDGGTPMVHRKVNNVTDSVQSLLQSIAELKTTDLDAKVRADLKKRKMVQEVKTTFFTVKKGANFTVTPAKPETELTLQMITTGSWKNTQFKDYNLDAQGEPPHGGFLHPLLKVRSEYRNVFLEMGFQEMPTNNFIESSFWNFDALFQPQQHPARDAHDTFFMAKPATSNNYPKDYMSRVKKVHSVGDYGSLGYNYEWKTDEADKNLLRTHTTAVSARMLYKLAQTKPFVPKKYFSIDRVFRNESLDATHLAEFHQIEGLVADYNLNIGHLMGVIEAFFHKLGIDKLRFKPAYNPYTEPSMEVFGFHPGLNKWVEIGNSGMFRPEMLRPMGLPENVSVIAWGLSLERPTMIKYGIDNIRDLIGPKVNLDMVHQNPVCRLDKD